MSQKEEDTATSVGSDNGLLKVGPTRGTAGTRYNRVSQKKLSFADDHGQQLVENIFVQNLHYSNHGSGLDSTKACCVIS